MKFPSLRNLFDSFQYVIKRFPFEMLFALIGTIAGIINVELENIDLTGQNWCIRVMMIANLGLLISLAVSLFCESKGIVKQKRFFFKFVAAIAAGSLLFLINPLVNTSDYIRFFLLALSAHLLVAFAAFTSTGLIQGFWQFNKTLFLRFLTGVFYSVALFLGLSAAIWSMNALFNADFKSDTFLIIWICIVGMFNTLFFLAGVPDNLKTLELDFSYPKGLKIFTQYVLIPLATVYVVILLAYEIKILLGWNLPKGSVSNLILGYAVFGILSILLVFPIKDQEENKWIKTYAKSFYFLMLPLIVLLFLAVGTRIFKYGITEYRYFLILLSCWLLFITLYFLSSRRQNIKLIPISLCLLTLLATYGPQSAFSVAMYSQRTILLNILKHNDGFRNGRMVPVKKISVKEGERAVTIVEFLSDHYGMDVFQPYINKNLTAVSDSISMKKGKARYDYASRYEQRNERITWLVNYLGLTKFSGDRYQSYSNNKQNVRYYWLSRQQNDLTAVKGYDFIIENVNIETKSNSYTVDQIRIKSAVDLSSNFSISLNGESANFDLKPLLTGLLKDEAKLRAYLTQQENSMNVIAYTLPDSMLHISKETASYKITFMINNVRFDTNQSKKINELTFMNGMYMIKKK